MGKSNCKPIFADGVSFLEAITLIVTGHGDEVRITHNKVSQSLELRYMIHVNGEPYAVTDELNYINHTPEQLEDKLVDSLQTAAIQAYEVREKADADDIE